LRPAFFQGLAGADQNTTPLRRHRVCLGARPVLSPNSPHALRGRGGQDRGSHSGTRYHKSRRKGVADDQDTASRLGLAIYSRSSAALSLELVLLAEYLLPLLTEPLLDFFHFFDASPCILRKASRPAAYSVAQ
jgi:hypothetical protein